MESPILIISIADSPLRNAVYGRSSTWVKGKRGPKFVISLEIDGLS